MAVTKIWPIKGRLCDVIDYTVNPEKTFNPEYTFEELQELKDVIDYAMESDKTEKQFYVTGVNCTAEFAREQMVNTKRLFKKEDGILAFHGYQSFKPGELTPELAHEIGIKLAEKLWGDRFEVVVSTHLDKHHLHSHFVLNSVSFVDGKKFDACRRSYREMRRASDELCRQYGMSVIENPRKAPSRMQYLAEKNGEMTKYTNVKRDIRECIISADKVEVKEVKWLWPGYIPYGKITLLQGDPGDGKSTFMLTLAALLTTGQSLPFCDEESEPMNVIYQTTEDDAEDTVVPRFIKAGGDTTKLHFINEKEKTLTFSDRRIADAIRKTNAKLVILDPLSAYIGGDVSLNIANDVRAQFNPLIPKIEFFRYMGLVEDYDDKRKK